MQHWVFRDFVTAHGRNVIHEWLAGMPAQAKADINAHIRLLEVVRLLRRPAVGLLSGDSWDGLLELRVKSGQGQYRPLGYYGPKRGEVTLLVGATERGNAFDPPNACDTDQARRGLIISGGGTTCEHDFS